MAPRGGGPRRQTQSQPEQIFTLGQAGRKTGVTLETGERDEHGFEDHENLFSSPSPERVLPARANTQPAPADDTDSDDGEDMELDDGSEAGPATIRKLQGQSRPSLPRSRSPIKTHLQSPARQNPHLGPTSSPVRGSIVGPAGHSPAKQVKRKLDFSASAHSQARTQSQMKPSSKSNGAPPRNRRTVLDDSENETAVRPPPRSRQTVEEDQYEDDEPMDFVDTAAGIGSDDYNEPEDEEEEEEEEEPQPPAKPAPRGRKPKTLPPPEEEEEEEPQLVKKAPRGRKPRSPTPAEEPEPEEPQDEEEEPEETTQPKKARGRPKANAAAPTSQAAASKPQKRKQDPADDEPRKRHAANPSSVAAGSAAGPVKGKPGRKPKSMANNVDSPGIQRGPPLPKARGLVSMRRDDPDGILTTRSGRTSVRPLDFWKNERYEFDDEVDVHDDKKGHFVTKKVKGVIRYKDETPPPQKRGPRAKQGGGGQGQSKKQKVESNITRDPWETDVGHIEGPCKAWYPEYETDPPAEDEAELTDKEIAVSEAAIPYKEVKGANFRFAKVLSNNFFGAGLLELPSGAEKSRKNSRKMQLAFFVSEGAVEVTVADNEFRIAKGGMFFIPRGNQYSIANEEDTTALLFFCQGAEVRVETAPQSQVL